MKINIVTSDNTDFGHESELRQRTRNNMDEIEINIKCSNFTPEVERIVSMLRMLDMQLTGRKEGEIFVVNIEDVIYIESVDKKTFIYTEKDVYETGLRLYELEERLLDLDFFRGSKSCIINFRKIISLKSEINRRIRATMSNQEEIIVSRQYSEYLKQRLNQSV